MIAASAALAAIPAGDRKSTRLNSSHLVISYAVFCLKKKKNDKEPRPAPQFGTAQARPRCTPSTPRLAPEAPSVGACLWALALVLLSFFFFFNDTATTEIYTLSLHDALPICTHPGGRDAVLRSLPAH